MNRGLIGVLGVVLVIGAPAFSLSILMGIQGLVCLTAVNVLCVNPNPNGFSYPLASWLAQFWGWNTMEFILIYGSLALVLVGIALLFLAVNETKWLFYRAPRQGTRSHTSQTPVPQIAVARTCLCTPASLNSDPVQL
jgi:hypothetical protein